ncbi:unnamed protein product [Brassica rapa subsp. narinosa]
MDFLSISIIPAARFYPNMGALNWHPLDLRHQQGLSLVAGLVGEPKETDDFTLNLVSLTLSHVKVEVDLTIPLPSVVEFTRESGEVVEVSVAYPWVPPTCTHCKELGHIMKNCLQVRSLQNQQHLLQNLRAKNPPMSTRTQLIKPLIRGNLHLLMIQRTLQSLLAPVLLMKSLSL